MKLKSLFAKTFAFMVLTLDFNGLSYERPHSGAAPASEKLIPRTIDQYYFFTNNYF